MPLGFMIYQANKIIFSVDIHPQSSIGGGFQIVHPFNIVVGARVTAGHNLVLYNGATLGKAKVGSLGGQPNIGNDVVLCVGSKVLGDIELANRVIVGAGSIVTKSVFEPGLQLLESIAGQIVALTNS